MDPIAWVQRLHDHPPKRPGEALAATLSALVTVCNEATPVGPKDITPEFFDALQDDPEFDDIAAEVLSVVSSYYTGEAFGKEQMGIARSSSTPRFEELPSFGAGFEHAAEAVGVQWYMAKEALEHILKYTNLYKSITGTAELITKVIDGPQAYGMFILCALGLVTEAAAALNEHGPIAAPLAFAKKRTFGPMVVGLLWFSGNYWTRVNLEFDIPSEPATVWTPYRNDRDSWWYANTTHKLHNPNVDELLQVVKKMDANMTLITRAYYNEHELSNFYYLQEWYKQNGHGEAYMNMLNYRIKRGTLSAQATLVNSAPDILSRFSDSPIVQNLLPAIVAASSLYTVDETELNEMNRLSEFLDIVIADYRNGNKRYTYAKNFRSFFAFAFVASQTGLLMYSLQQRKAEKRRLAYGGTMPENELHGKLLLQQVKLLDPKMRPYWGGDGNDRRYNAQSDINDTARIIVALAKHSAFDDLAPDRLEDLMQQLLGIRRSADKHTNNPESRGELNGDEMREMTPIRDEVRVARDNWDGNNPNNQINASCAGGGSSVVDALFASVGL